MAKKRKDGRSTLEISSIEDEPRIVIDRNEMMKLTEVIKSWEFTCSFCFKKFPSAQSMGGHQNAHRSERLEEKRLFVRDPIAYRKRAFLRAVKSDRLSASEGGSSCVHAAREMVKTSDFKAGGGPPRASDSRQFNWCCSSSCRDSSLVSINGGNHNIMPNFVGMNYSPPKELSLAESVGDHAGDGRAGKACIEFNIAGYGINLDHKLDLTLKL